MTPLRIPWRPRPPEELPPTQHPARWHRVFWAFLLGLLPITLVYLGGLKPLQSAVTLVSVPLFAVIVLLTVSLYKSLRADTATQDGPAVAAD